jgi:hypothetical protein
LLLAEDAENCSNSAVGERGGGTGNRRSRPLLSHLLEAGVGGGKGRGRREQIRPCSKCNLHAYRGLSFSYLRSAATASFDIKSSTGTVQHQSVGNVLRRVQQRVLEKFMYLLFLFLSA